MLMTFLHNSFFINTDRVSTYCSVTNWVNTTWLDSIISHSFLDTDSPIIHRKTDQLDRPATFSYMKIYFVCNQNIRALTKDPKKLLHHKQMRESRKFPSGLYKRMRLRTFPHILREKIIKLLYSRFNIQYNDSTITNDDFAYFCWCLFKS